MPRSTAPDTTDARVEDAQPQAPARSLKQIVLRNALGYSAGAFAGTFVSALRAAVSARYLPAGELGLWLGLQVLLNYAMNVHLGVLFGMARSVPLLRAASDDAGADEEKRVGFSFLVTVTSLVVVAAILRNVTIQDVEARRFGWETLALAIVMLLKSYFVTTMKAEKKFGALSRSMLVGALVGGASLFVIPRWSLDGLIWGLILQNVVEMITASRAEKLPRFGLSTRILREQFRVGAMTLAGNVGIIALMSVDRTAMLRCFGALETANYALGANIALLLPVAAAIPASVLTPHFFDKPGDAGYTLRLVLKPMTVVALVFAPVIAVGLVVLDAVVDWGWPHLAAGNVAAKVALVGTFPMMLVGTVTNVFYALDRQRLHLLVLAVGLLVSWGAALLLSETTGSIGGAAAGAAIGTTVYFVGSLLAAMRLLGCSTHDVLRQLGAVGRPLIVSCVVAVLYQWIASRYLSTTSIAYVALGCVVCTAFSAPLLLRVVRLVRRPSS